MSEQDGVKDFEERITKQRATWGHGPWDNEPNREAFEAEGLPCIVQRGGSGSWCGYVGIPPGHPLHGKDLLGDWSLENSLEVHGGITYAEACQGGVCHVPKPGEPADVWWLGFDCNHSCDRSPRAMASNEPLYENFASYRSVRYAKRETERLAKQLREMVSPPGPGSDMEEAAL